MFHTSASKDPGAWRSDRIGLVQKEQSNSAGRGYLLDIELASHPAYLAALYEGFYHTGAPDQPLTARKVPVFARVDGTLSCYYHGMLWRLAARRMGVAHAAGRTGLDYGEFFGTRSATA